MSTARARPEGADAVADVARHAADYGVRLPPGPVEIDLQQVRAPKDANVQSWRTGSQRSIDTTPGLGLVRGSARFVGPRTVEVDGGGDGPPTARSER